MQPQATSSQGIWIGYFVGRSSREIPIVDRILRSSELDVFCKAETEDGREHG